MILMYCQSTYKFSPVGLDIGCVTVPITNCSEYTKLKRCRDNFVRYCFEAGSVRNLYGRNPNNKHYYFSAKHLRCEFINEDNMPSHKRSSFLFEFDNVNEYRHFVINYDKSKLEAAMNEFIVPDSFAETFALKLDTQKLNNYIAYALSGNADSKGHVECNNLYFDISSSDLTVAHELTQILGYPVHKVEEGKFSTKGNFLGATLQEIIRTLLAFLRKIIKAIVGFVSKKV